MIVGTCMQETKNYNQNKHQNLCSTYCCLKQMQINSNTVTYLSTDGKIISNDCRAAGITASSLAFPTENQTGKILLWILIQQSTWAQGSASIYLHCTEMKPKIPFIFPLLFSLDLLTNTQDVTVASNQEYLML